MTEDKSILIKNIFYMLAYAFQELKSNSYEYVGAENFERIHDLFAEILYRGMSLQIKQGIRKEYREIEENLPVLKGKINIDETITLKIAHRQALCCQHDELSENCQFNRIMKTTLEILLNNKEVASGRKKRIRGIMPYLVNVDTIDVERIDWTRMRFDRNTRGYAMLMNICYMLLHELLQNTEEGKYKLMSFSDKCMERVFEKFVLNYYKHEYKDISVTNQRVAWDIDDTIPAKIESLPTLNTDITLQKNCKTLIIDTKYYRNIMQSNYDKNTVHSGNLYQIFTYVKNMDKNHIGNVQGMLLYAKTDDSLVPKLDAYFGKNRISVECLDLNKDFDDIKRQLDGYIAVLQ